MRSRMIALTTIALGFALAACGGGGKAAERRKGPPPPPRSPLTGLIVADAGVLKRPVMAIKVENSRPARPQAGLGEADIVYEELAEGGITRFIALYHSQDVAKVGPVRSARLVDPQILVEYRAALAYSGAHHLVQKALVKSGIPLLAHGRNGAAFWRAKNRFAPHNLYTSTAKLWALLKGKGSMPPSEMFRFNEQPPALPSPSPSASPSPSSVSAGPGAKIPFSYSQTSIWRYDSTKDAYLRWQGSNRHLLEDGSQVQARNVLVLFVKIGETAIVDAAGNNSPDVVVTGTGKLALYRNGIRVDGTWTRASEGARSLLVDRQGAPIMLAPGATWVELVPVEVEVTSVKAAA